MIYCKKCGYEGAYISKLCPVCRRELTITDSEIAEIKNNIEFAVKNKETETVIESYHILADFGDTDGEREWAKMLEKGNGVSQNIDSAMDFYRRAAEKFDPFSAYKYSELLSRINDKVSRFWLEFSAFLDYRRAYFEAAKSYIERGESEFANHYLYLASAYDDIDAIVLLAERYYKGEGIVKSPEIAKWYMERLSFPPLHALRLSLRLRSFKSKEAPNISFKDRRELAINLIGKAKKLGLSHPVFYLTSFLFEEGEIKEGAELGEMYLTGFGTKQSSKEGLRTLSRAAASGSARAYMSLGKIYFEGIHAEKSLRLSIECFEKAANLGLGVAYEQLGDIYHSSDFEGWSIPTALAYYQKGAAAGSPGAKKKADKILEIRDSFYKKAVETAKSCPEESFKNRLAGAAMGHSGAKLLLAESYARGIGTKPDRAHAFSLWKSAADDDYDRAYLPLGMCYAYGFGTSFDFDKALKALSIADKRGDSKARGEVKRLIENKKRALSKKFYSTAMRLIYIGKFDKAKNYLEAATELLFPKAIYTLGCLYEFGKGTRTDKSEAYRLYALADSIGYSDNRSKYKFTILKMLKK